MKKRSPRLITCDSHEHRAARGASTIRDEAFVKAAAIFRAAGDEPRLRLLELLGRGERCVTEMAETTGTKLSTLSQQLRVLRSERIVASRRDGKHIFYSLADDHVRELVDTALAHASEHEH